MPRKQRFKPSRKPKQTSEEIGKTTSDAVIEPQARAVSSGERLDGVPSREREEHGPDDVEDHGDDAPGGGDVHREQQG